MGALQNHDRHPGAEEGRREGYVPGWLARGHTCSAQAFPACSGTFSRASWPPSNFSKTLRSRVTSHNSGQGNIGSAVGPRFIGHLLLLRGGIKIPLAAAKYVFEGSERWGVRRGILEKIQKRPRSTPSSSAFSPVVGKWQIDAAPVFGRREGGNGRRERPRPSFRTICESVKC